MRPAHCTLLLALGLAAGCTSSAPPAEEEVTASGDSTSSRQPVEADSGLAISAYGVGPVRAGMTTDEASAALRSEIRPTDGEFTGCVMTQLPGGPAEVSLMIVGDTVVRVDVRNPTVSTEAGARIGDPEARIRELYDRVVSEPHKYTEGRYLIFVSPQDTLYRIVFETDEQGRVTTFRSGRTPEVHWVEGCG